MAEIDTILRAMTQLEATDLHLRVGSVPRLRIGSSLRCSDGTSELSAADVTRIMREMLTEEQAAQYATAGELDFSYSSPSSERFRCNYFRDHWGPAAVLRRIPERVPTLRELNLPPSVENFAHLKRGLVLVTGASGAGKTATLAAMIGLINNHYRKHIITLEDPIEYLHTSRKAVIHQRGINYDIVDFQSGIFAALRQDPDVLVIGELRDTESIRMAVSAAESGLLVLATLHTNSAVDSVDRIINSFPSDQQPLIRTQLADSMAGIVSQVLMDRAEGTGRVPATEILMSTPAISGIIREGNTQDLINAVQSGRDRGMHSLDDSLEELVRNHLVDPVEAQRLANNKKRFARYLVEARGGALVGAR